MYDQSFSGHAPKRKPFFIANHCVSGTVVAVLKTYVEQVVEALREDLEAGRWTGTMPGRDRLARELGVNGRTVDRALSQLETEGMLESQGEGRARKITLKARRTTVLEVKFVLYERSDRFADYVLELQRRLESAGHRLTFGSKSLIELKQDPVRVARMVEAEPAPAWILQAAARPVLKRFSQSPVPFFACFGSMEALPIAGAGPRYLPPLREALEILIDRGHRKIVMLAREERRTGELGVFEQGFLDELEGRGISTGPYNLPEWEESPEGLRECLDRLFAVSPPTAVFIEDRLLCLAVKNYLAAQRGAKLRQVVLICTDYGPSLDWCDPPIPHFKWDKQAVVRRMLRWVDNVARGKKDLLQQLTPAKLVGGDCIMPAAM